MAVRRRGRPLELERADVPLFASEQSWGGLCTHIRDGWNIG
ncbi:hypothetical protein OG439_47645 [Amycolatopsis sp. NBC_01307]|nr:hypothetical protein OG439_47645 [Amycolatopsis sp. NBC_01307]